MSSDALRGQKALAANDYPAAINHLTAAIKTTYKDSSSIVSPTWLLQRSTAYQRTGEHSKALKDANLAHYSATQRGRRELIATSQFRRAVAYHGLGQFGNARMCLTWTHKYNEKEKGLTIWQAKVKADYDKAGGEEAECNKVTCVEKPAVTEKEDIDGMFEKEAKKESKGKEPVRNGTSAATTPATKEAPATAPAAVAKSAGTTIDKIRVEWYQTNINVTIEILCKGIPKENAAVMLGETQVSTPYLFLNHNYLLPTAQRQIPSPRVRF
jgi:suppressor of G2 allele of SKP1